MAALSELMARLAKPPEEVRAEQLRHWASTVPGATPITHIEHRQRARAAGVVENIRIDPREGSGSVEATISDGTGSMVARWLGRSSLAGIKLGTGLVIEGIVVRTRDGELAILNPEYELVSTPLHG